MKQLRKKLMSFMLALCLILSFPLFSSYALTTPLNLGVIEAQAASKVRINKKKLVLIKGQTYKLKVKGTKKKAKWKSSKKSVVTVNRKGKITARKKGSAVVSAKVGGKTYKCKVTVETPSISRTNLNVTIFSTANLYIKGTSQEVYWYSDDNSIAAVSNDGVFGLAKNDSFMTSKTATVYFDGESEPRLDVKIRKPNKAVEMQGDFKSGENADFKLNMDDAFNLKFDELAKINKVEVDVTDVQNRETEKMTFVRNDDRKLVTSFPTKEVQPVFHWDVLALLLLFIFTMVVSQRAMMAMNKNVNQDPQQAQMQKSMNTIMPLMFGFMFFVIPIPAGVLLYLVSSNCFQVVQSIIINKQLELEDEQKANKVSDIDLAGAKQIQEKE